MKYLFWLFVVCLLLSDSQKTALPQHILDIVEESSEIGGAEDLMGRLAYLRLLTADPKTGIIPPDIKRAEIAFTNNQHNSSIRGRNNQQSIRSLGPENVGGRTRAVAFDVRDENVILAGGVSGGVWKSIDGGLTWIRKSDPENRNSVTCIVQDVRPGREDVWYHGTGEIVGNSARGGGATFRGNGIYKSTDNGESWNALESTQDSDPNVFNSQFQYIWNIEINPANLDDDEVLVAAFGGILRSLDGGMSWSLGLGQKLFDQIDSVDLNESNASFYTSLERSEANVFYASLSTEGPFDRISPESGLYFSHDGESWVEITPLTEESTYRRVAIGTSPSNPNIAYFMLDSNPIFILEHDLSQLNNPSRIRGFDPQPRIVPDFEESLGDLNTQGSYNMMIKVHPDDPNVVFIGGTNLYRSTDAFRTNESIEWIGGYNPEGGASLYPSHHPDQHDLLFLPSNPDAVLSANDGGLYLSQNVLADSVIWQDRNDGYVTSQFFTISQSSAAEDPFLIGGLQDNGTYFSDASISWQRLLGGDGAYSAIADDRSMWLSSFQRGQTLRLTLSGELSITSFGRVDPGGLVAKSGSLYLFINPFVLDPTNQNRMFCAGGNHLYFHPNISQIPGGSQKPVSLGWKKVNENPILDGLVSAVETSFDGGIVFYGTSIGELFRLENANDETKFNLESITSSAFPENSYVSSISINPENDDHVVVAFSNYNIPSIFESRDGGETFENISGTLEENVDGTGSGPSIRWIEIVPKNIGEQLFVGTSVGLYSTEDISGINTVWNKESPGIIGNSVVPMLNYRASDGRLLIATHGNGVFETTINGFKELTLEKNAIDEFRLLASYPNPFTESTEISFTIPEKGEVRLDIYSSHGELINTILWANQFAGVNSVVWEGDTPSGTSLANGTYLYRLQYKGQSLSGRLILKR